MYTRVVRFNGVSADRMQTMLERVKDAGGPPPGITASGISVLFDESQGTAVVLQHFPTAEDMEASARIFEAMDSSETPGTRLSVDACEVKLELSV